MRYLGFLLLLLVARHDALAASQEEQAYRAYAVSSPSELIFDENGKLERHTLVFPSGPCEEMVKGAPHPYQVGFDYVTLQGNAVTAFLPPGYDKLAASAQSVQECPAMCLERGVDQKLVTTPMPHRYFHPSKGISGDDVAEERSFRTWFDMECVRVEIGFMNYLDKNQLLKMYWKGPDDKLHHIKDLKYGERNTHCSYSYVGHVFQFYLENDPDTVVYEHVVEFTTMRGIGDNPDHGNPPHNIVDRVRSTLRSEWSKQNRIKRTFTELGFAKGRLPDDLFASMGAFYYNNRHYKVREEWQGKGLFVNWWEVDVYFIQVPWEQKKAWQGRLRELVEEWTGVDLEQTDMYGLRRYEEGARLLTHVDREATHAASLIVNIAQGNVTKPWPVEVHDHGKRLHQVTMEPGDIVYYESAACLHGRNTPLTGPESYYVNLFTHYRPTGDPKWLHKQNPEGTPPPLLDVGECRLKGERDALGVGAVQCDNPKVGPYLSPAMLTATNGEDLFNWWMSVGPDAADGGDQNDEL